MNQKIIIIALFAALLFMAGLNNNQALAGGIPTSDVVAISQRVKIYALEIKKYQEMLNQSTKMTQKYIVLTRQLQQKLREYKHYLNQIKALKNSMDRKDWLYLLRTIRKYGTAYGKSEIAKERDPNESDYEDRLSEALQNYDYQPRKPVDVEADARSLGIWSDAYSEKTNENYYNYQLHKERIRVFDKNRHEDELMRENINMYADKISNLGDESDLATQQALAVGNLTLMRQNRILLERLNQLLLHTENQRAQEASKTARVRDMEIKRLKNLKPSPGLGRDRFF